MWVRFLTGNIKGRTIKKVMGGGMGGAKYNKIQSWSCKGKLRENKVIRVSVTFQTIFLKEEKNTRDFAEKNVEKTKQIYVAWEFQINDALN